MYNLELLQESMKGKPFYTRYLLVRRKFFLLAHVIFVPSVLLLLLLNITNLTLFHTHARRQMCIPTSVQQYPDGLLLCFAGVPSLEKKKF